MSSHSRPAKLTKAEIAREYGRRASGYDFWGQLTESRAQARCLEMADIRQGEQVLEVAVGTGLLFSRILEQNRTGWNVGVDLTEAMLAAARNKATVGGAANYDLFVGDAYNLSFGDGRFDLLFNGYMFDLLPQADFAPVLAEFWRVLRPGGRLALLNFAVGWRWYHHVWDWLSRRSATALAGCRWVSLRAEVAAAGFILVQHEFISQNTFPSEVLVAVKDGG